MYSTAVATAVALHVATLLAHTVTPPHAIACYTTCIAHTFPKQVDASQVTIGANWQPLLQSAGAAAAKALDIDDSAACSIGAHLYKLLLYEQGGHFAAHQDTEKEAGMIGTLVV